MKIPTEQLERVVALLTIGLAVAVERGKVTTAEANQLLFSPHAMTRLRSAGVREVVVDLVHAGTEIEDIEFSLPERVPDTLDRLVADALTCLETCDAYDFNSDNWISQLLSALPSTAPGGGPTERDDGVDPRDGRPRTNNIVLTRASDVQADELRVELAADRTVFMDLCGGTVTVFGHPDWVLVDVDALIDALLKARELDRPSLPG